MQEHNAPAAIDGERLMKVRKSTGEGMLSKTGHVQKAGPRNVTCKEIVTGCKVAKQLHVC